MDLTQVMHNIQQLTEELNVWLSSFALLFLLLDYALTFLLLPCEKNHSPPLVQLINHLNTHQGSVALCSFFLTYSGEESWPVLCWTLKEAINGCSLITRQAYKSPLHVRKLSYQLSCSHCRIHENKSRVIFKDDGVGPSNVPKEHLKRVTKSGNNSKGATMYNNFHCLFYSQ